LVEVEGEFLMITISQLTKTFGKKVRALIDVDLVIGSGMFGLIGPNGAGKTTLMRILAGLMRPTSGKVSVLGLDPSTERGKLAIKSVLGYLPQELGLYPDLTAFEFLEYVALLKGMTDKPRRQKQLFETLELVGLEEVAKRKLHSFSGGMKRRVGIAQALLGSPQLLIVDEPTSGLDPEERVRLRNLMAELSIRCTVILSTHIVEDISQSCSDLAVIDAGKVLFHGDPSMLIDQARGKVWTITSDAEKPPSDVLVVSTMHLRNGTQYRMIGAAPAMVAAVPVEPSLEDGYLWLMRQKQDDRRFLN
jgi:ABC-2 type transport system ATP-binding protein